MNCQVCGLPVPEFRGGNYCLRCAGMHGVLSWSEVKAKRMKELDRDKNQRKLFV